MAADTTKGNMKLGDKVSDKITGFSGIITGKAEYLTGCIQYLVTPQRLDNDGKMPDGAWIDESRLGESTANGGPQRNAPPTK